MRPTWWTARSVPDPIHSSTWGCAKDRPPQNNSSTWGCAGFLLPRRAGPLGTARAWRLSRSARRAIGNSRRGRTHGFGLLSEPVKSSAGGTIAILDSTESWLRLVKMRARELASFGKSARPTGQRSRAAWSSATPRPRTSPRAQGEFGLTKRIVPTSPDDRAIAAQAPRTRGGRGSAGTPPIGTHEPSPHDRFHSPPGKEESDLGPGPRDALNLRRAV
jgi:hypothetical protein